MISAICGIGLVGGFGCGLADLENALSGSEVLPKKVPIPTKKGPISVPCLLADIEALTDYIPLRELRRMSRYTRLGLLAAFEAMADANILEKNKCGRLGIIVASSNGATGNYTDFQYPFSDHEESLISPIRFSNSVHNAAAAHISIALKEMGPNHSVAHDELSFPSAMMTAIAWLQQRRLDTVLVGGVDELNHSRAYAWHVHQQIQQAGLKTDAAGIVPPMAGEGACFFVLKRFESVADYYGVIKNAEMGRADIIPNSLPGGAWYFLGNGGIGTRQTGIENWVPSGVRSACYATIYGDLAIDNAFDTAIAAFSIKKKRIFSGLDGLKHSAINPLRDGQSIICLKLGAGNTYGWIVVR